MSLRIVITADPELPVPPKYYGGIERVIDLLARQLVRQGHEVALFAHPASASAGQLIAFPGRSAASPFDTLRNATALTRYILGHKVDVIHSFSRLQYLLPLLPFRIPKVMTYQRAITRQSVISANRMAMGSLRFTAISHQMMKTVADLGTWHVVPNCTSPESYHFAPAVGPDAPLMFLGRIEEIKGTHLAIEVAQRTGLRLCIAGNVPSGEEPYFNDRIKPFIDGKDITYVGRVDDAQKNALLGRARALLMPVLWDEPFGIVMVEAMACGTPVIGLARGAVSEVVADRVSGFVRSDLDGLVEAVQRVNEIDRRNCRVHFEKEFSDVVVAEKYLRIYRETIAANQRAAA